MAKSPRISGERARGHSGHFRDAPSWRRHGVGSQGADSDRDRRPRAPAGRAARPFAEADRQRDPRRCPPLNAGARQAFRRHEGGLRGRRDSTPHGRAGADSLSLGASGRFMAAHHTPSRHHHGRDGDSTPYRWVILGLGILAYGTSLFARQNYSGVQRFVAQDLHLDKAALGLLGSVFFYTYAFAQMPWGLLADKLGSRWVTSAGVLLTALSMVGFASAQGETGVFVWRG